VSAAFDLEGVIARYGERVALDVPRLEIEAGSVTALVGPNGAGKTTLLHVLAFLHAPARGRLRFAGEEVSGPRTVALRRRVGLVPQRPYLLRGSVRHNVEIGLRLRGVGRPGRAARVDAVLERLGIAAFAERPARALSGGEAQKVAIARTLALEPEALLLDEPFTHLDRAFVDEMERFIAALRAERTRTVVFTTHEQLRAHALGDRVLSLMGGRPVAASLVNLFHGTVRGRPPCFDTGRVRVALPDATTAARHVAIEPSQVVLSREPLDSSMRNSFRGRVAGLAEERGQVRVTVEAGERFQALVTRESVTQQGLALGAEVWVSFKSTAVHVF